MKVRFFNFNRFIFRNEIKEIISNLKGKSKDMVLGNFNVFKAFIIQNKLKQEVKGNKTYQKNKLKMLMQLACDKDFHKKLNDDLKLNCKNESKPLESSKNTFAPKLSKFSTKSR